MGGHAFKGLHCPRISPAVYNKVKEQTTDALRTIFAHVVVPTEMPCKDDYGDVDFLVCGPLHSPESTKLENFAWKSTVKVIKKAFETCHGRTGGNSNRDCMYFCIDSPYGEEKYFIQIDVKVCFKPELFHWYTFELNYASNSKILGSMMKPLGLTIDPEGLHIRVEEIEETDRPGSMVYIGKDPKDVLRLAGLDRRIMNGGFQTKDEIYEYFSSSWLFNPGHFLARMLEDQYNNRLEDRSPHWVEFIKEWLPRNYPGFRFVEDGPIPDQDADIWREQFLGDLHAWYKRTRTTLREKVFTMFPHVAAEYYTKRAAWAKDIEEQRLRELIIKAIPSGGDGWKKDFPEPKVFINQPEIKTPELVPTVPGELTPPPSPPLTPTSSDYDLTSETSSLISAPPSQPWDVPLYLDPLPRTPPLLCNPHPPLSNMSQEAKLVCLARWTLFNRSTGAPYLLSSPRDKDFEMCWTDATYAGATDTVLNDWAKHMWWYIWIRQSHVNYVGMWKKRFEKEDKKAEKARLEKEVKSKAEELVKKNKEKIMGRLQKMNEGLGVVGGEVKGG